MPEKVELNTDIGAFLPTKLANFLRISQFEISELHQLLERTEQELRTVPSVKEKSVSLIKETLAKYGYTLK
jgi:DNA-directed RNA polymerase alpha subunit